MTTLLRIWLSAAAALGAGQIAAAQVKVPPVKTQAPTPGLPGIPAVAGAPPLATGKVFS